MTLPSHAALFSSRHPFETGILDNESDVPGDLPLLAEHLARHGYATSASITISPLRDTLESGFDSYQDDVWGVEWAEDAVPATRRALKAAAGESPFFLFVHFADPHAPYRDHETPRGARATVLLDGDVVGSVNPARAKTFQHRLDLPAHGESRLEVRSETEFRIRGLTVHPPSVVWSFERGARFERGKEFAVRLSNPGVEACRVRLGLLVDDQPASAEERTARYRSEVRHVDGFVGRLLGELRRRGLYDETLILFTSDHGEGLGQHGEAFHSGNVYDEQIHVPLVIKPPAGFPWLSALERRADSLVRHVDVVPTVLEILGLPPLPGQRGSSLLGEEGGPVISHAHPMHVDKDFVAIRDERFKLILDLGTGTFQMYDVREDPGELRDVFAEDFGEREEWQALLREVADQLQGQDPGGARSEEDREKLEALKALGY